MSKLNRALAAVLLTLALGGTATPLAPTGVMAGPGQTACC
jgi:hypothetical protein